ncbi:MAG: DUF2782 domain-containing protein [bacterium]
MQSHPNDPLPATAQIPSPVRGVLAALLLAACGALLVAFPAAAQQRPSNLEPLPDIPPPLPATLQLAPGVEPEIRIIRRDKETVEEFRVGGQLYMMRVTPVGGGTPYYLVDYFGDGNFARTATYDSGVRVPMWVIRSW